MTENSREKFKYRENEKCIQGKKLFSSFLRGFQFQKVSQTWECAFNAVKLHLLKSLKLTVQIQLALHPCDPFLVNNRNVTGNIVGK